jgi:hypothetical protein
MILISISQPHLSPILSQSSRSMISVSPISHLRSLNRNLKWTSLAATWTSLITLSLNNNSNPYHRLTISLSLCLTLEGSTDRPHNNHSKMQCKLHCNIRCKCNWCSSSNNMQLLLWWVEGWISSRPNNNNNSFTIRISTCQVLTSIKPLDIQWCSSKSNSNQ